MLLDIGVELNIPVAAKEATDDARNIAVVRLEQALNAVAPMYDAFGKIAVVRLVHL